MAYHIWRSRCVWQSWLVRNRCSKVRTGFKMEFHVRKWTGVEECQVIGTEPRVWWASMGVLMWETHAVRFDVLGMGVPWCHVWCSTS